MTVTSATSAADCRRVAGVDPPATLDQPGYPESPPVSPFTLLRVAYGMLLGVEDFRTVIGYARGKHGLHQAWLHGRGVVWGYGLSVNATELVVRPGLAVDGLGRDLRLETARCIDVADWLRESGVQPARVRNHGRNEGRVVVDVVARAGYRLTDPVPALADPADPSRRTDDYSRFHEDVVLDLLPSAQTLPPSAGFHRVRVLFGLDSVGDDDPDGAEAAEEAAAVAALPPPERPAALLAAMRRLARLDVTERAPLEGSRGEADLPVPAGSSGVVLARVTIRLLESGTVDVVWPPDWSPRSDLLPTALLQELACGGVPAREGEGEGEGGTGRDGVPGRAGPRVVRDSVSWESDDVLQFRTDAAVRPRSVTSEVVHVSSVSEEGDWFREQVSAVEYADAPDGGGAITVRLEQRPTHDLVRLVVVGTGPTPVLGLDGLPLAGSDGAGSVGGDERAQDEGRDAVVQIRRRTDDDH